ncbi:MAG: hypothetical protein EXS08_02150 [Planctomycetes bacterium]|nr:hypothetical protein [Planctomycetota bacterium]
MKQEIQDALALELVAAAAVALSAWIAGELLQVWAHARWSYSELRGALRSALDVVGRAARAHPPGAAPAGRWLQVIGVLVALLGLALVLTALRGLPAAWAPAVLAFVGGAWLNHWAEKAFIRKPQSASNAPQVTPPAR